MASTEVGGRPEPYFRELDERSWDVRWGIVRSFLEPQDDCLAHLLREISAAEHGARRGMGAHGPRAEKSRILDEFEAVTSFHRKHAMRVLRSGSTASGTDGRGGRRIHDDAVREALVVRGEASDRICGKRLKALMPTLVATD